MKAIEKRETGYKKENGDCFQLRVSNEKKKQRNLRRTAAATAVVLLYRFCRFHRAEKKIKNHTS